MERKGTRQRKGRKTKAQRDALVKRKNPSLNYVEGE